MHRAERQHIRTLHIVYKSVEIQSAVMIPGVLMFIEFDSRVIVPNHT